MGGLFIGALISGQIGDIVGRRITYFLSVIIVMAGNLAAAFSINWQMFAAFRFCIGMGCGWYLTVFGAFIAELTPKRWRSVVLSVPTWAFGTMSMGLVAWLIHDWKYIQIATAIFCLPWICGFWYVAYLECCRICWKHIWLNTMEVFTIFFRLHDNRLYLVRSETCSQFLQNSSQYYYFLNFN